MTLKENFENNLKQKLKEELKLDNIMELPKLEKITLNMGVGEAINDKKYLTNALKALESIAGQKPVVTKARRSEAGFKIREGWPVGCKVTLRKEAMYNFFDKLVSIVLPRVRDFRGVSRKSFDGFGNYSFGIKEHTVFPEIKFEEADIVWGMDIVINTSTRDNEKALQLLKILGMPFKK